MPLAALLSHRSIFRVGGPDRLDFLQGLISNDVKKVTPENAIHAALPTPQGKFLHDLFVGVQEDAFWLECEKERIQDLLRRLTAYKLRAKVTFEDLTEGFDVWAIWNNSSNQPIRHPREGGDPNFLRSQENEWDARRSLPKPPIQSGHDDLIFSDPRLPELGFRAYLAKGRQPPHAQASDFASYDDLRLKLGVADGSRDLEIEKSTLAEGNFDFLNGIDWNKGCYVGQELTARMHYRGLAKKRLFPVRIEGTAPPAGALLAHDAGEMRSHHAENGLALLRIESVRHALDQEQPLTYEETRFWPSIPSWMKIDGAPANR